MASEASDILIFKLRGAKPKQETETAKPKTEPERAQQAPPPSGQPGQKIQQAIKAPEVEELKTLEERVAEYMPGEELEVPRITITHTNPFAKVTGVLLFLNAAIFAYYVYPSTLLAVNSVMTNGVTAFILKPNLSYLLDMWNFLLAALSGAGGILMLARVREGHLLSAGFVSVLLLTVSYEYLNSNYPIQLLVITVLAFISIVSLAFSRMSAVGMEEREGPGTVEEVNWPRVETF